MKTIFPPSRSKNYPNQLLLILLCVFCFSAGERTAGAASGPVAVLTSYIDSSRTGANLTETILTTNNVNTNQFGLLYTRPVDDQIYAQPLIMTNVTIPGKGVKNLLLVATVNDSVYAFDADDASVTAPYWAVSFINPPNIVAPANTDLSAIGACGAIIKISAARWVLSERRSSILSLEQFIWSLAPKNPEPVSSSGCTHSILRPELKGRTAPSS